MDRKDLIEMIPVYEDPDRITCYHCDYCGAIFTLRCNEDYPLCPDCYHNADRITKARFNLIKYFRLKRSRKTVPRKREPEEEFVPGTNIPRIKPKRGY